MTCERGKQIEYIPTRIKKHMKTMACKGHDELLFPSWQPPTEVKHSSVLLFLEEVNV